MMNCKDHSDEQRGVKKLKKKPKAARLQVMIDARKSIGMTQKQLAERTGVAQSDISRLETGNANPSLKTLQKLAEGMGMSLRLEFVPIEE